MASLRHALIRSFLIKRGPGETRKRLLTLSSALYSELRQKQIDLLSKYPGGSVDLEKNDKTGIAVITLNNPGKKNALTGLQMRRSLSHVSFSICSDLRRRQIDLLRKHPGGSVDLEVNDKTGIALMTLNNPKKKNAITGSMHLEFEKRIEELEKWETGKGLIVKGWGNTFCSGGDLNFVRALAKEKNSDNPSLMSSFMQNATTRLSNLPLITVALVEGFAVGGGAELMTCCDFRVVHSSARIGFLEAQMGLSTGWGGSVRLVHLLGRSKALQLLTSARVISGMDAQKIGLADEIFGVSDDPLEATTSFLTKYLKFPSEVIKAMKRVAMNASKSDSKSVEHLNAKEKDIFQNLCGGPANLDALNRK